MQSVVMSPPGRWPLSVVLPAQMPVSALGWWAWSPHSIDPTKVRSIRTVASSSFLVSLPLVPLGLTQGLHGWLAMKALIGQRTPLLVS